MNEKLTPETMQQQYNHLNDRTRICEAFCQGFTNEQLKLHKSLKNWINELGKQYDELFQQREFLQARVRELEDKIEKYEEFFRPKRTEFAQKIVNILIAEPYYWRTSKAWEYANKISQPRGGMKDYVLEKIPPFITLGNELITPTKGD